jgi:hypothetical protein
MIPTAHSALVLALRPFGRGFAFVLFESPLSPVDWGIKEIRGSKGNARCLAAVRGLIEKHPPEVIVIPAKSLVARQGSSRIERLLDLIVNHATGHSIEIRRYTEAGVRACFAGIGANTRYEIAQGIASQIPAFAHRLPPVRQTWDPIDSRMYLFDAAALAMTYYASTDPENPEE